jgi:hypothetical protein
MTTVTVTLTPDEQAVLVRMLKVALGETRVELHHTRAISFREEVKAEEALLRGLLSKVTQPDA